MSMSEGQKGLAALKNRNYAQALDHLDKALEESLSPNWLLHRSQAHQQLGNLPEALRDAELAYHQAVDRGSGNTRQQMIDAQYRRAVVYFHMGRFADADCCAKWSQLLCEGRPASEQDGVEKIVDKDGYYMVTLEQAKADTAGQPGNDKGQTMDQAKMTAGSRDWNRAYAWRCQALSRMEALPKDDPGRKVTVKKVPERPVLKEKSTAKSSGPAPQAPSAATASPAAYPPAPVLPARADFYQTDKTVTIAFYVKDVDKEAVKVNIGKHTVVLGPLPRIGAPDIKPGDPDSFSSLFLFGDVNPENSRFTVTPRKIELVLEKAAPGAKWPRWGKEEIGPVTEDQEEINKVVGAGDLGGLEESAELQAETTPSTKSTAETSAPVYPTSSKSGPKNWEKLADAEAGDDDDDGKDVNFFFKQLYKGATPEQQRAMMKSFTESNGTALSTDWEDVGKRTVEMVPPEGVDPKKWDS